MIDKFELKLKIRMTKIHLKNSKKAYLKEKYKKELEELEEKYLMIYGM